MRICGKCGAKLAGVSPPGLCPKCFLQEGLTPAEPASSPAQETSYPPADSMPGKPTPESPPGDNAGQALAPRPPLPLIPGYDLLRELSHGGQGIVYQAVQKSTQRNVAIKVLLEGSYASEAARRRFEREIELVSHLQHPHIIAVFDSGVAADGRLYYVMDYVVGKPLMAYVRETQPTMEQGLALFASICDAVHYAHQKGVIHRDLKPSNILVDTEGNLHVLDFGLAKAITEDHDTLVTLTGQVMGTLPYMSPEQARGGPELLDVRTDVYALGVILYQMLTGAYPYPVVGQMAEVLQHIAHTEPTPPTRRWTRGSGIGRSTRVRRHAKCPINHEVETIVLKALAKERERRYQGAGELAKDVRHYLANEPIEAKRDSGLYVLKKTLARHRVGVSAAAAIIALVAGSAVVFWVQRNEARRARAAAEASESRAMAAERDATAKAAAERAAREESEATSKFIIGVFQSPNPARDGRTITVAETLDKAVTNLDRDLGDQPALRAQLEATLGHTYLALGLYSEAIPLHEKALDYYRRTAGPEHPDTLTAIHNLATTYHYAGSGNYRTLGYAGDVTREAVRLRRKVLGPEHPDTLASMLLLVNRMSDRTEGYKLRAEVLRVRRKALGPEHPDTIMAMNYLAFSQRDLRRLDEALKLWEEVLRLSRKVLGPEHPDTIISLEDLGNSYCACDRREEGFGLLEQALALRRTVLGPRNIFTRNLTDNLVAAYVAFGRTDELLKLREEVLTLTRKVLGPEHPDTIMAMNYLAEAYFAAGRRDEALKLREEVLRLSRKVLGPEHPATLRAIDQLAEAYFATGRRDEALKLREEVLTLRRKVLGPEHPATLQAIDQLAEAYFATGRRDERRSRSWERSGPGSSWETRSPRILPTRPSPCSSPLCRCGLESRPTTSQPASECSNGPPTRKIPKLPTAPPRSPICDRSPTRNCGRWHSRSPAVPWNSDKPMPSCLGFKWAWAWPNTGTATIRRPIGCSVRRH